MSLKGIGEARAAAIVKAGPTRARTNSSRDRRDANLAQLAHRHHRFRSVAWRCGDLTPIEYALKVMNDEGADAERRDRLCIALLPYLHARRADRKKEQVELAAHEALYGT